MLMAAMNTDVSDNHLAIVVLCSALSLCLNATQVFTPIISMCTSPLIVCVMERLIAEIEVMNEIVNLVVAAAEPIRSLAHVQSRDVIKTVSATMKLMISTATQIYIII